jgi:glycosyltransferase involved in cell wall biosynthesis
MMVSCLLVTLPIPQRFAYAQASIAAFCNQTHASKELIIVLDPEPRDGCERLAEYVNSLRRNDIRIVVSPEKFTLGRLRDLSIDSSQGDILCQWDDDDLYHPQRLEHQLAILQQNDCEAVYLRDVMQYFPSNRTLYWTNWQSTEAGGHPGTLMVRRSAQIRYPTEGANAKLGEDLCVALFLRERGRVCYLPAMPHLFVYVSHGNNSWNDDHHQMLASELCISKGLLQRREAEIRNGLAPFEFGPGELNICGRNGLAFTI